MRRMNARVRLTPRPTVAPARRPRLYMEMFAASDQLYTYTCVRTADKKIKGKLRVNRRARKKLRA